MNYSDPFGSQGQGRAGQAGAMGAGGQSQGYDQNFWGGDIGSVTGDWSQWQPYTGLNLSDPQALISYLQNPSTQFLPSNLGGFHPSWLQNIGPFQRSQGQTTNLNPYLSRSETVYTRPEYGGGQAESISRYGYNLSNPYGQSIQSMDPAELDRYAREWYGMSFNDLVAAGAEFDPESAYQSTLSGRRAEDVQNRFAQEQAETQEAERLYGPMIGPDGSILREPRTQAEVARYAEASRRMQQANVDRRFSEAQRQQGNAIGVQRYLTGLLANSPRDDVWSNPGLYNAVSGQSGGYTGMANLLGQYQEPGVPDFGYLYAPEMERLLAMLNPNVRPGSNAPYDPGQPWIPAPGSGIAPG